jgi:large subunit ribosomal protein L15
MNVQARPRPLRNNYFRVNDSPQRLDEAYLNALGRGGDRLLDEEVKWLAVTHKSFDQGRRGFNDRLAYLGKRIVELQTSLAFLSVARPAGIENLADADQFGRMPYRHNALANLPRLSEDAKRDALDKKRVARLAQEWGLDKVTRWKPRRVDNLQSSGLESVLATTVYAIVGAVALQRGGELANAVVRERLMPQLGIS